MANKVKEAINETGMNFFLTRKERDFNKFYHATHDQYRGLLLKRYVNNDVDAEDILSLFYLTIYEKIHLFDPSYTFYNWAFTILVNTTFGFLKKKKRKRALEFKDSLYKEEIINQDGNFDEDIYQKILIIVEAIPYPHKEMIIDKYFNDYNYEELMVKYNFDLQTVKNMLFKTKIMIRAIYNGDKSMNRSRMKKLTKINMEKIDKANELKELNDSLLWNRY